MHKKCWSYELRYKESVTPSLTSGGTESVTRRGVYLLMRFAHIGGVEYKYIKDIESNGSGNDVTDTIVPEGVPVILPEEQQTPLPENPLPQDVPAAPVVDTAKS